MAGDGQHQIVVRRLHQFNIRAKCLPELHQSGQQMRVGIGWRSYDAPAVLKQAGKACVRPGILGTGYRMRRDDRVIWQCGGKRGGNRLFATANIADESAGRQGIGDFGSGSAHGAGWHAENHQLCIAHRFGAGFMHRADQPAFSCAPAGAGVVVIAGGHRAGQVLAQRQPDRSAKQAKSDYGNARERHVAASAISPNAAAIASI